MNRLKNIIGTGVLMILALPVLCQEWIVPDEEATLANPSEYTLDNVKME
jgi:hypothetical protein